MLFVLSCHSSSTPGLRQYPQHFAIPLAPRLDAMAAATVAVVAAVVHVAAAPPVALQAVERIVNTPSFHSD